MGFASLRVVIEEVHRYLLMAFAFYKLVDHFLQHMEIVFYAVDLIDWVRAGWACAKVLYAFFAKVVAASLDQLRLDVKVSANRALKLEGGLL